MDPEIFERVAKSLREIEKNGLGSQALRVAETTERRKEAEALREAERLRLQEAAIGAKAAHDAAKNGAAAAKERALAERAALEFQHRLLMDRESRAAAEKKRLALEQERREVERSRVLSLTRIEEERARAAIRAQSQRVEEELKSELRTREMTAVAEAKALAKAKATAAAQAARERENHDLLKDIARTKARAKAEVAWAHVSAATKSFVRNPTVRATLLTTLTLGVLGVRAATRAAELGHEALRRRLLTPRLIRVHKQRSSFFHPSSSSVRFPLVLAPEITTRLERMVQVRAKAEEVGGNARKVGKNGTGQTTLLAGPPGTGKTTLGRFLAEYGSRRFAMCSGGVLASLPPEAAERELRHIFNWARRSRKGVTLFIDEADAFLAKAVRDDETNLKLAAVLAIFLEATGTRQSTSSLDSRLGGSSTARNLDIILATNRPEALDPAVLDRVDHRIDFDCPQSANHRRLILHFHLTNLVREMGLNEVVNARHLSASRRTVLLSHIFRKAHYLLPSLRATLRYFASTNDTVSDTVCHEASSQIHGPVWAQNMIAAAAAELERRAPPGCSARMLERMSKKYIYDQLISNEKARAENHGSTHFFLGDRSAYPSTGFSTNLALPQSP